MRVKHRIKKGIAVVLSGTLMFGMAAGIMPGRALHVQAATTNEPSVTAYATKAQLMDGTFAPDDNGTASNIGMLAFGKDSGSATMKWYILGADSGVNGGSNNTVIFAASPIAKGVAFNDTLLDGRYDYEGGTGYGPNASYIYVYSNHYGASVIRKELQSIAGNTTYFSQAEQALLQATKIVTEDTNGVPLYYTTCDKLYLLNKGSNDKIITAGSNESKKLAMNTYWSPKSSTFWLRTAVNTAVNVYYAGATSGVHAHQVDSKMAVIPAANLDLSKVLFASAAKASQNYNQLTNGSIQAGEAMTLRLDGSAKDLGTITYDAKEGKVIAKRGSCQNVSIMIQGKDGTNDWFFDSLPISASATTYTTPYIKDRLKLSSDINLSRCKIWLETTDADGITYAVEATPSSPDSAISSVAVTGIDAPVANTALDTSAACADKGVNTTAPAVTWTPNAATAGYDTSYTASVTLTADIGYNFQDPVSATVNGKTATSAVVSDNGSTLTITYQFPKTAAQTPSQTTTDPAAVQYKIIEGADSTWKQNTGGNLVIRGDGEVAKFQNVKVDGAVIDAKNYTVTEGSTVITLKADYLKTLSVGKHTFEIVWTDGSAGTSLTIVKNTTDNKDNTKKDNTDNKSQKKTTKTKKTDTKKKSTDTKKKTTDTKEKAADTKKDNQNVTAPSTGDNTNLMLLTILLMASLACLTGGRLSKKEKNSK